MKAAAHTTFAERMGRGLGRRSAQLDQRMSRWLVRLDTPSGPGRAVLVAVKIIGIVALLDLAFWPALMVTCVAVAAWAVRRSGDAEPDEWAIGDQADHKRSPFYDPINYNDDPDPRF